MISCDIVWDAAAGIILDQFVFGFDGIQKREVVDVLELFIFGGVFSYIVACNDIEELPDDGTLRASSN